MGIAVLVGMDGRVDLWVDLLGFLTQDTGSDKHAESHFPESESDQILKDM